MNMKPRIRASLSTLLILAGLTLAHSAYAPFAPLQCTGYEVSAEKPERPPSNESHPALANVAPAAAPQTPAEAVPVELQPYRVQLHIGFENAPEFGGDFRKFVLEGVREGLKRYIGEFWQCAVVEEDGRLFAGLPALKRLRIDSIARDVIPDDVDKVYLLSIQVSGASFSIAGREWDTLTRRLGAVAVDSVRGRREIPESLLAVVHDLFRPIAVVEPSKAGPLTLRARAGEFPPRDASWQPLPPGRIFETFYCFLNKDRVIERVQQVPFTYLASAEPAGRGVARATVSSGLRAPLTSRRRILPVALGINRRGPETRLTLVTRPPARKPLAGIEVEISAVAVAADEAKQKDKSNEEIVNASDGQEPVKLPRLVADRNGVVSIGAGASPSGAPVWLFVKSGQALLARVPYVPGVQSTDVLELPDDTLRLETEGDIALLQAKLVDAVARRAVLMAQVRNRAKANDWTATAELLQLLDEMRPATAFIDDVSAIRIPRLKTARTRRDRTTEARIEKLCDETTQLVKNYLDADKLKELREEIIDLQQIAANTAAAEADVKAEESKISRPDKKAIDGQKSDTATTIPSAAPAVPCGGPPP